MIYSCDKNEITNEFSESLTLFEKKYNFINYSENEITPSIFNITESVNSKFLSVSEENFNEILLKVNQKYGVEYSNNDIMVSFYGINIEIDNITDNLSGISIISNTDSGFFQDIYKIKNLELNRLEYFSKSYAFLLTQHFAYMTKNIDGANNSFLNIIKSSNTTSKTKNNKVDIKKINILYPELNNQKTLQLMRLGNKCSDCNGNYGFCAWNDGVRDIICESSSYIDDGGVEEGEDPICSSEQTAVQDEILQRTNSMYYIKYFILNESLKGNEYIKNYYKLSRFFYDKNLFESNKQELTELIDFIEDKAILFVFSKGSKVMINDNDAFYLQNMIDKYRLYDDNLDYQIIFNNLEGDLQIFKNKTKSEIANIFE